ncbi:DNA (cytosine-5-)-methyltransferase [Poriferisphaera sp. WC338]|uniref:DNA (cytosine-5-)-methyltransferase n=1 Tax=Poriferisphaera sp. WC338 TaxID=3425129 RepID=UPI003D815FB9
MKKQFGMKNIPGDLWAWVEFEAYARDMDINLLVCKLLEYARSGHSGLNPLESNQVVRPIKTDLNADTQSLPTKNQFCLRSIPDVLWRWLQAESAEANKSIKNLIVDELRKLRDDPDQLALFMERRVLKPAKPKYMDFTFIDLFAGIGGFRLGLQRLGGKCVFTSEWDKFAQQTYEHWFGDKPEGDINDIDPESIPDHDILAAGFPCQPFSIAGVSKKNSLGQKHGFNCERQGNLFFTICDIAKAKRPKVMILENVKNLKSHDKRRTWPIIESNLEELGYTVCHQIIDAADYVPQHRERIFIVCFRKDLYGDCEGFEFPEAGERDRPKFKSILERKPDSKYILTNHLWNYLQNYAKKHQAKGNGFGFGMTDLEGISRTLSARYYKDGSEVLIPRRKTDPKNIPDKSNKNPRRLTPVEAARLMGFREAVTSRDDIPVSDTQSYKQFGNAVVPDVVEAVGDKVLGFMSQVELKNTILKSQRKSRKRRVAATV